jgi:hypothetical protein
MGMKFSGMPGVLKSASILSLSLFVLVPSMAHAQAQPKQSDAAAEKGRNTAVAASREIRGLDNNSSNGSTPTPAPAASTPAPAATPAPAPAAGGRAQARNQGSARNASSQSAEQAPARGRSSAREPREYSTMTSRTETPPWNADWQKHRVARIRENYPIVDYTDSVENGGNVVREGYGSKRSAVILNGKRF